MDYGSIERLELKPGETVTAQHIAQLDRAIGKNNALRGPGVRRRIWPWGTSHSYSAAGGGGGDAPVFQPDVSLTAAGCEVRWSGPRATIGGLAPKIGEAEIFSPDAQTGDRPMLFVPREAADPATGECGVFFEMTVGPSFFPVSVTPIVAPKLPDRTPFKAHKLALFLRLRNGALDYDPDQDRELFSSQGFLAINQRTSGVFEPLWWAKF